MLRGIRWRRWEGSRKQIGDDIWIGAGYIELIRLGVFKFLFDQLEALSPPIKRRGGKLEWDFLSTNAINLIIRIIVKVGLVGQKVNIHEPPPKKVRSVGGGF